MTIVTIETDKPLPLIGSAKLQNVKKDIAKVVGDALKDSRVEVRLVKRK